MTSHYPDRFFFSFLLSHIILLFKVNSPSNLSDKEKTPSPCCDLLRPGGHREVRSTATPSTSAQPHVIQMSVPFYVDGLAQDVGAVIIRVGRPLWGHRKRSKVLPRTDIKPLRHRMPVEWAAWLGSTLHHGRFFSIVFLCGLLCSSQLLLPQRTPQSPWNSCFGKASGSALRWGSVRLTSMYATPRGPLHPPLPRCWFQLYPLGITFVTLDNWCLGCSVLVSAQQYDVHLSVRRTFWIVYSVCHLLIHACDRP